jgi:DNA-binding SARP family transcriptional activator/uncharacterized protein HemY
VLVVQVLGPTRAWRDSTALDLGPTGRRAVFGLLALASGRPLARRELIDALWGDRPPDSATNVIQTHVKHLRRLLEPGRQARAPSSRLPMVGDGYALHLPTDVLDVARFRDLTSRAAESERSGDLHRTAELLSEALRLWRGLPLADVPILADHPQVLALVGERRTALARYAQAMVAIGRAADVIPILAEDAAANHLDESAQARLVRAYHAAGQRAQAFATYDSARRLLSDELGVGPGPELVAAYLSLLEEPPAPPSTVEVTRPAVNQLPGDVFGFTGRSAELAILDAIPGPADATATTISLLTGTAGVGKTALAVHWAHRTRKQFPDGQLYVDLRGYDPERPMSPGEALARLLDALGVAGHEIPLDLDQRAARYRSEISARRMLVVLDNASSVDQVRPLLPGTPNCLVLATSRDSLAGLVALHGARRLDLDLLPEGDARTLLRTLVGDRVDRTPESAAALAEQCARLPLALRVAAEMAVSRPATPLSELVDELADRQRRLQLLDPGGDVRAAVRVVFSWSYQSLPPDAAQAFRRIGVHPAPDFDAYAVAALAGVDLDAAQRVLDALARAHLVWRDGSGRFGAHDLLRAYAMELARECETEQERSAAVDRLLDHYLATAALAMDVLYPAERANRPVVAAPNGPVPPLRNAAAARAWLAAERPTLVATCAYAAAHDRHRHAVDIAATLYRYLEGDHYPDALALQASALRAARLAGSEPMQAITLTNLGAIHRLLGNYGPAGEHLRAAIDLHRRTGDRLGEARATSNLGIVADRTGDHDTAARHHLTALAVYRDLGHLHGEASTLINLGGVYTRPGSYTEAAELLERALVLFRELGDRVGEASALANLGDVYTFLGRYVEATRYLREAHALFRATNHRYGQCVVLSNLGNTHARLGDHVQAAMCFRESIAVCHSIGHRYGEASALNGLGDVLRATDRPTDALTAYREALALAAETGDVDEQVRAHAGIAALTNAVGFELTPIDSEA